MCIRTIRWVISAQWDSRLRKVDNKFVSSGARIVAAAGSSSATSPPPSPNKKPLLRESKLQLNTDLVEDLRSNPEGQAQFYEAIQRSMQSADKLPPKLLMASSVNPAGTALVEESPQVAASTASTAAAASASASASATATKAAKVNNRTPGNIVCGICGAVRYYAYIQQAKKFGTFSCEPCRKFISKVMRDAEQPQQDAGAARAPKFDCVQGRGDCVVPPVAKSSSGEVRCQACWLKLCLIGYQLEAEKYDQLRALLPAAVSGLLPSAVDRDKEGRSLLPHRGQILEFNRQVPLSRPLFDGLDADEDRGGGGRAAKPKSTDNHVVHERLPNGWTKKAVKNLAGEQKGRWVVFLITPDQRMIRTEKQLKLYIGKSGAVIDANIVNFSLPKKTAKVDKALQKKLSKNKSTAAELDEVIVKTEPVDADEQQQHADQLQRDKQTPAPDHRQSPPIDPMAALPRSRRRETKVPLKYRHDLGDLNKKTTPAKEKVAAAAVSPPQPPFKPIENGLDEDGGGEVDECGQPGEKGPVAAKKSPPLVARPSGLIGVGTFSIDEQSVRGK